MFNCFPKGNGSFAEIKSGTDHHRNSLLSVAEAIACAILCGVKNAAFDLALSA